MTNRLKGCTVVFDSSIREDDAQPIIDAILMLKGVREVTTSVDNADDWMNRTRVKLELFEKIAGLLRTEDDR